MCKWFAVCVDNEDVRRMNALGHHFVSDRRVSVFSHATLQNGRTADNNSGNAVAYTLETLPPGYAAVLGGCLKRLNSWRIPPNWSASDWFKEIKAIGAAAAWQAEDEFDPSRGVPMCAFLYQRILARVFTRYRQEWAYALHLAHKIDEEIHDLALQAEALLCPETVHESESVRSALDSLSSLDRKLVVLLFWKEHTESQIARSMGISQSAVSKRKHVILRKLRNRLESAATVHRAAGSPWG
jgi:RNA polymerase sigma factor (sigma-70 family)